MVIVTSIDKKTNLLNIPVHNAKYQVQNTMQVTP